MKRNETDAFCAPESESIASIIGGNGDFAAARSNRSGASKTSLNCSLLRSVETVIGSASSKT